MTIHFASFIKHIPSHDHSDFMYFFFTKPLSSNERGSVKIGITETQTLHKRLGQYKHTKNVELSITPINIYYIHTKNVIKRESVLKRMMSSHSDINCYQGTEYFEGNIGLMLNTFAYSALSTLDEIDALYAKKSFKSIFNRVKTFKYDVTYLTELFPYTEDDSDIENIVYDTDFDYESDEPESDVESNITSTDFPCPKCGKYCKDKRGLSVHSNKCRENRNFICEFCNLQLSTAYNLSVHITRCKTQKEITSKQEFSTIQSDLESARDDITKLKDMILDYEVKLRDIQDIHNIQLKEREINYQKELSDLKISIFNSFKNELTIKDKEIAFLYKENKNITEKLKDKAKQIELLSIFNNILLENNRVLLNQLDKNTKQD
jgi:hypothetical protein